MMYTHAYASPLGPMTIASDGFAITGLWFDGQKYDKQTLDGRVEAADLTLFKEAREWLDCYFSGNAPSFSPPLSIHATPFREEVWRILRTIPFGETLTYGEIAKRMAQQRGLLRMSAQAIGNAVGHNPIALIIPCHRVVGANGSLTGYAAGLDRKRALLDLENAALFNIKHRNV